MGKKDSKILRYFKYDVKTINDREAYEFYKQNRRRKSSALDEYHKFKHMVGRVFLEVINGVKEEEDGVYLPLIGYFCGVKTKTARKKNSLFLKNDVYKINLFPSEFLQDWTMDYTGRLKLNNYLNHSGKKYKPNFKMIESYQHYYSESMIRFWANSKIDEDVTYNPKIKLIDELI